MPKYKKALEAMCKYCTYDPDCSGTWREQTEAWTCPNCPLYELRPRPINFIIGVSRAQSISRRSAIVQEGKGEVPLQH